VWVDVTPFGTTGPRADLEADDLGIMATAGNLWMTGDPDRAPVRCAEPLVVKAFTASELSFRLPTQKKVVTGHGIDTQEFRRAAEFLSFESESLLNQIWGKRLKEIDDANERKTPPLPPIDRSQLLNNPTQLAQLVWDKRFGNRSIEDTWKYRARGLYQIEGREQYVRFSRLIGYDLIENPDAVSPVSGDHVASARCGTAGERLGSSVGQVARATGHARDRGSLGIGALLGLHEAPFDARLDGLRLVRCAVSKAALVALEDDALAGPHAMAVTYRRNQALVQEIAKRKYLVRHFELGNTTIVVRLDDVNAHLAASEAA
jgi:hypothetical protein